MELVVSVILNWDECERKEYDDKREYTLRLLLHTQMNTIKDELKRKKMM